MFADWFYFQSLTDSGMPIITVEASRLIAPAAVCWWGHFRSADKSHYSPIKPFSSASFCSSASSLEGRKTHTHSLDQPLHTWWIASISSVGLATWERAQWFCRGTKTQWWILPVPCALCPVPCALCPPPPLKFNHEQQNISSILNCGVLWTPFSATLNLSLVVKKSPEPPGCLILEDLQTLHIPTNKKLEVWTQYFFLSLVATSLPSREYRGKGRFV